jgi:hypothetical protein
VRGQFGERFQDFGSLQPRFAAALQRAWTAFGVLYPSVTDTLRTITACSLPFGWVASTDPWGYGTPSVSVSNNLARQRAIAALPDRAVQAMANSIVLHEGAHARLLELWRNGTLGQFESGLAARLGVTRNDLVGAFPFLHGVPADAGVIAAIPMPLRRLRADLLSEFGWQETPDANLDEMVCYALERSFRGGAGRFTDAVAAEFREAARLGLWDLPTVISGSRLTRPVSDENRIDKLAIGMIIETKPNADTYFSDYFYDYPDSTHPFFEATFAARVEAIKSHAQPAARLRLRRWQAGLTNTSLSPETAQQALTDSRFDHDLAMCVTFRAERDALPRAERKILQLVTVGQEKPTRFGSLTREAQELQPSREWLEARAGDLRWLDMERPGKSDETSRAFAL